MIVIWDDYGRCIPDTMVLSEAKRCIKENGEFHVANRIAIEAMRLALLEMDEFDRPDTEWIFYGDKYNFDEDMNSKESFKDWRLTVLEDILLRIYHHRLEKSKKRVDTKINLE